MLNESEVMQDSEFVSRETERADATEKKLIEVDVLNSTPSVVAPEGDPPPMVIDSNLVCDAKEEEFHNGWAEQIVIEEVMVDESFECITAPEGRKVAEWLGDITGKKVLDVGCGAGEASVYFAKQGADVTASDLSLGMLGVVNKLADRHGVKVKTAQATAEVLPFPDDYFDVVYTGNLLHHVDLEKTLGEMRRVLKPGGSFVSWDPLAHNPVINIYRMIATKVRTPDEHPLRMSDIKRFSKYFHSVEYETYWLTTLWIFVQFCFIERVNPNRERYWKKVIKEHTRLAGVYGFFDKIDRILLKCFPSLKRFCWNVVIRGTK